MSNETNHDGMKTTADEERKRVEVLENTSDADPYVKNRVEEKKILASEGSDDSFVHKGRIIDKRFKIESLIGAGGQCTVLKARDLDTTEKVAIKHLNQLPSGSDRNEIFQRFKNEAKAIGNLKHGDIIQLKTTCEDEVLGPLIVLEYVDGKNLGELVKSKVLEPKLAAKLFIRVGKALAHAHNRSVSTRGEESVQDIIHRDMKPSNILIGNEEKFYRDPSDSDVQVKIADFGLGKFITQTSTKGLTGSHRVMGTPSYMSPEQMRGEEATKASDIYSLGATLYETLTGRPPFTGQSFGQLYKQVLEKEPTPPRVIDGQIPAQLDAICLKCLEKRTENRYQRVEDFVDDLRKYLDDNPNTIAKVPGVFERTLKVIRKNPVVSGVSAGCAALILTVFLSINYYINQQKENAYLKSQNDLIAEQKEVQARNNKTLKELVEGLNGSIKNIRDSVVNIGFNEDTRDLFKSLEACYSQLAKIPIENEAILERSQIANANLDLAELIEKIGTPQDAIQVYDNTIKIYDGFQAGKESIHPQILLKKTKAMGRKSWHLMEIRNFIEARTLLTNALEGISQLEIELAKDPQAQIAQRSELHKTKGLLFHYRANLESDDDTAKSNDLNAKSRKDLVLKNYKDSIEQFRLCLSLNQGDKEAQWFLARAYGYRGDVFLKDRSTYVDAEKDYHDSHKQRIECLKALVSAPGELFQNDFYVDYKNIKSANNENKRKIKEAVLQLNRSFGNFSELNYNQHYLNSAVYFADLQFQLIENLYSENPADYECLTDYISSLNKTVFYRICKFYDEDGRENAAETARVKDEIRARLEKLKTIHREKLDKNVKVHFESQSATYISSWIQGKMLAGEALLILEGQASSSASDAFKDAIQIYDKNKGSEKSKLDEKLNPSSHFFLARIYGFLSQNPSESPEQKTVYTKGNLTHFAQGTSQKFSFDYDTFYLKGKDPAFKGTAAANIGS